MAAICTVTAPQDLFGVCNKAPWLQKQTELRFVVAGVLVYTRSFPALLLDAPFTHVKDDGTALPPPPGEFPRGIDAARIFSCPMAKQDRAIRLLPNAIRYVPAQNRHFYVELDGSFAEYLQKFSAKSRSTLKRKVRKYCEAAGSCEPLRQYRRPEEMEEFHRLAMAVSTKTYQHKLLDAGLPDTAEFRREMRILAAQGRVCGNVLMFGERPASYSLCHSTGRTFTLGKTGFDPELAHCHPGTVLTYLLLKRLFHERRFDIYDFGCGDFAYKEFFATGNIWCGDVLYFARTVRNLALVVAHYGLNGVSEGLKEFLEAIGLRARIKKLIHHGI